MKKTPVSVLGFVQALALAAYIGLVGLVMWYSQDWSEQTPGILGVLFFLTVFVTSALISGLITLGYPAYLFFKQKKATDALRLIFYTVSWLILFLIVLSSYLFGTS